MGGGLFLKGFTLRGMKLDFEPQLAPEGFFFVQNRDCKEDVGVSDYL